MEICQLQHKWRAVYSERGKYGSERGLCKPTAVMRKGGTLLLYCSNESVSMLENAGHLGLPIPQKLKDVLEQLHERSSDNNDNGNSGGA